MTEYLYITADRIGMESGGGAVTHHESEALAGLGAIEIWSLPECPSPWGADEEAVKQLKARTDLKPKLAHFYAGTFSRTIDLLKERGCKVTYTAAAHDIKVSRQEHEKLGWPFDYPHLNDPKLWKRYLRGYLLADHVFCPSKLSAACMVEHGCQPERVIVIPHGVHMPATVPDLPTRFGVAYLGQPGADKGLVYLLRAWALLNYRDALLTIAGRGTEQLLDLVRKEGASNIYLRGWVDRPAEVYGQCRVYVQPSASEGFGLEVLEAMAHGRPVVCSDGAGACDVAKVVVPRCNPAALAEAIDAYRREPWRSAEDGKKARQEAEAYTWDKIRERYIQLWRAMP